MYLNIPYDCGHLEVEVPPGCYWAFAGLTSPTTVHGEPAIHLNYASHVGIVEVGCNETACVKLFNPTAWLCWNWAIQGLRMLAIHGGADRGQVEEVANLGNAILANVLRTPVAEATQRVFADLIGIAEQGGGDRPPK